MEDGGYVIDGNGGCQFANWPPDDMKCTEIHYGSWSVGTEGSVPGAGACTGADNFPSGVNVIVTRFDDTTCAELQQP